MTKWAYRKQKKAESVEGVDLPTITSGVDETLTGFIRGEPANSEAEERFARELDKNSRVAGYEYNKVVGAPKGMPGWRQLDFLVLMVDGFYRAFSMKDLSFIHHGAKTDAEDAIEEAQIVSALSSEGIPIDRIETLDAMDYDTQELAHQSVEVLL
jgi:hypothetical protein